MGSGQSIKAVLFTEVDCGMITVLGGAGELVSSS